MKSITRIALALLSGLLIAFSWPTYGFTPLIFIAFVPLLFLQDRIGDKNNNEKGSVFWLSFLTFLVWNSITTWWVWNSTAAGAVAMLLLNSVFMATIFWLYHFTRKHIFFNKNGFFLLIFFFLAFEYLHYNWQLNWPWLSLGNVFSSTHSWIQWYEFTGVAGGTIWVLLSNILVYKVIIGLKTKDKRQTIRLMISLLALLFIPLIISKIMYNTYDTRKDSDVAESNEVEVVVVQPNIDPYNEEFSLTPAEILWRNFSLADTCITDKTRFVISPESSIHENIWLDKIDKYYSIKKIREFSGKHNNIAYIIGASTFGMVPEGDEDDFAARKFYDADEYYYAYNTALMISDSADIQYHQKSRLTPGVEMMPSWWFLRPIRNYAIDLGGIVGTLKRENEPTVLSFDDYNIATLICYESVFGDYVTQFAREGANLFFVITNDGWWGDTEGHRQHLELSKLRAIENRRSIARSANTGISAIINERGDIVEQTSYWEPDAICSNITVNDELTFYSKHGDYLYRVATFLAIITLCFSIVLCIMNKKWYN